MVSYILLEFPKDLRELDVLKNFEAEEGLEVLNKRDHSEGVHKEMLPG